jgi:hypothetical protein
MGKPAFESSVPQEFDAEITADLHLFSDAPGGALAGTEPLTRSFADAGAFTGAGAGSYEDALGSALRQNINFDIVQQAQIILRDGGEGAIKLNLKPEALGSVKISLEMAENKITGHIFVESAEAFKAFEREIPVLEKQFQESGFSEARLDLAFSGGDTGRGAEYPDFDRYGGGGWVLPEAAAAGYEAPEMRVASLPGNEAPDGRGINILA